MAAKFKSASTGKILFCLLLLQIGVTARSQPFDIHAIKDIEAFNGSAPAKELLRKNGFVVADPFFKQIFEAYINGLETARPSETNERGSRLPSFITVDSAWDTYHVLLEEGVKQLEEVQAGRLREFSHQLLDIAQKQKAEPELLRLASVGLALQDEPYRGSLAGEDKRVVDGLCNGSSPVQVGIGFELSPLQFRAQSFYTQSQELSDYFAARQWYASVVFRLAKPKETKLAVALVELINYNPELLKLWKQLSDPYDNFLARAEDGTIPDYAKAVESVEGTNVEKLALTDSQVAAIQKKLETQLPLPFISDQLLQPEQYSEYGKQTRGFRLLPPRRLPCAVCFQNTVDPKIRGRGFPSGLDFFAASPELRSPAAVRAVQSQSGKDIASLILKADCGPMPDSLHGQAMQLLATLQKPLPAKAPGSMRNDAWSDLQLWTQLGAWAEQRHTWALHSKMNVSVMGIIEPPTGTVAPYPEFFSGLAKLTRQTAKAFEKAGQEQSFDVKIAAAELLDLLHLSKEMSRTRDAKEYERLSVKLEQLGQFQNQYYEQRLAEMATNGASNVNDRMRQYDQMEKDLEDFAQQCATNAQANESETKALRMFYDCRESVTRLLDNFAPVCDRLAALATKSLNGEVLTEDDAKWIENYGVTLAGFHFYYGNSYEVPRDDFPIVTRIFSNPLRDSMLYAGLARPQALYIVLPKGKSLQLYRGAVMTYREFIRPNTQLLDDDSWREIVSKEKIPPAPPFTQSFYAQMSVGDWLKVMRVQCQDEDEHYHDIEDTFWQLNSRATDQDLPELLEAMANPPDDPAGYWVGYIGQVIGHLSWKSQQGRIIGLLSSSNNTMASVAAGILVEQPAAMNPSLLTADFSRQPLQTRRLYCALLSRTPQPPETARQLFLQAFHDPSAGMRWQGVFALEKSSQDDLQSQSALLESLNDTNVFVASAAAHALGNLRATNSAPVLFARLKTVLQVTNISEELLKQQLSEVNGRLSERDYHAAALLDPDGLTMNVELDEARHGKRFSTMRMPPMGVELPSHDFKPAKTLIEALGNLGYTPAVAELFKLRGGDNDAEATRALNKLAPDQLTDKLMATATDKQTDSYLREKAMVTLCEISATNRVRDLVPLLDDTTPIEYDRPMRGAEWRVCDRAAGSIGVLLGWQNRMMPFMIRAEERDAMLTRAREWAKQLPPKP
jgi:hypothetical protein